MRRWHSSSERYKSASLSEIFQDLDKKNQLLRGELRRRAAIDKYEDKKPLYALDFDIIYEYLYDKEDRFTDNVAKATVQSFLGSSNLKFTLLPGTIYELLNFLSFLARPLPSVSNVDDLLGNITRNLHTVPSPEANFNHLLKDELINLGRFVNNNSLALQRITNLMSAENLIDFSCGRSDHFEDGIDTKFAENIFRTLSEFRPNDIKRINNAIDSINLATCLASIQEEDPFLLITKSKAVHISCEKILRQINDHIIEIGPSLSPDNFVFALGLSGSTDDQLQSLYLAIEDAIKKMSQYSAFPSEPPKDISGAIEQAYAKIKKLQEVSEALAVAAESAQLVWQKPTVDVPDDLDLNRMAERLLIVVKKTRKKIRFVAQEAANKFQMLNQMGAALL